MSVFLTVLVGDTPETAEPILATRDPHLVDAVVQELLRRLRPDDTPKTVLEFPSTTMKDSSDLSSEDPDGS